MYVCTYAQSQENFFPALWASVWYKNEGGGGAGPRIPALDPPLLYN